MIRTLHLPDQPITTLAVADDGRFFISAAEHILRVWDIRSGTEIVTVSSNNDAIACVEIFNHNTRAICGLKNGALMVWDVKNGRHLYTLQGHKSDVRSISLWGDDRYAVSDSEDGEVILWDLESRQQLSIFIGTGWKTNRVEVREDGKCVVSAWVPGEGENVFGLNMLTLWDMAKGSEMYTIQTASGWFRLISDERMIIDDPEKGDFAVYDLETGAVLGRMQNHLLQSGITQGESFIVFNDGKHALSMVYGLGALERCYYLEIYNIEAQQRLYTVQGHAADSFVAIRLTPDDRLAVSATIKGEVRIWDIQRLLHQLSGKSPSEIALSMLQKETLHMDQYEYEELQGLQDRIGLDMLRLLAQEGRNNYKPMWSNESASDSFDYLREELLKLKRQGLAVSLFGPHTKAVNGIVVTPDGKQTLSVSDDGLMKIWDIETQSVCRSLGTIGEVQCIALSPNGENAISSRDEILKVWDLGRRNLSYRLCDWVASVFPSAAYLLYVLDLFGRPVLRKLKGHAKDVFCVAVTKEGYCVLSGSIDKTIKVWNLKKGKLLRTMEGHQDTVSCIALMVDDTLALSGSVDCTIRLWDWKSGQLIRTIEAHSQPIISLVATADGEQFISSAKDGTIKVWQLNSALEPQILAQAGPHAWFSSLAVSDDANLLVAASIEGKVTVFDLRSGTVLAEFYGDNGFTACAIARDGKTIIAGDFTGQIHFLHYVEGQGLPN